MVAMAQNAANWRNTLHSLGSHTFIHSHTYINTVTATLCEAPALHGIAEFETDLFFVYFEGSH